MVEEKEVIRDQVNSMKVGHFSEIQGWCDFDHLYDEFVSLIPSNESFVEVGVWRGRSICSFASKAKSQNKKIKTYAVDHFLGSPDEDVHSEIITNLKEEGSVSLYEDFQETLDSLGLKDDVQAIQNDSEGASAEFEDESVFGCFIDAGHTFEDVTNDLKYWYPKVKQGGFLSGHDYHGWNDVQRAVDAFFLDKEKSISLVPPVCWFVEK